MHDAFVGVVPAGTGAQPTGENFSSKNLGAAPSGGAFLPGFFYDKTRLNDFLEKIAVPGI